MLRVRPASTSAIRHDTANQRIPLPTQTGNLIVDIPGTRSGPRLLFMTHLDTVPLGAGAKPVRKDDRIVPAGPTWEVDLFRENGVPRNWAIGFVDPTNGGTKIEVGSASRAERRMAGQ